jgi:hypothetical protein
MDIKITLTFDASMTPNAVKMSRQELKDCIEDAMVKSDLLTRISRQTGDWIQDVPSWDFAN